MKKLLFSLMLVGLLVSAAFTSQSTAAEFHVTDATGFQNALDTSETNGQDDTIYLAAGTYGGNFTYLPPGTEHKSLTIIGESGISAEDIILDGQNSGGVFYLFDWSEGDVAELTIQGMSIVNGNKLSEGGGILAVLAAYNITVKNCIIMNNTGKRSGGGIAMLSQWDPPVTLTLENSMILNNSLIEGSDGVSIGGGASLGSYKGTYIIRNNIIAKNSARGTTDPSGGGIKAGWHYDDVIHLFGNTIYGNQAGKGGGIFVQNGNTVNVYNNIIYGNTASEGEDMHLAGVETNNGYNNNYSSMFGTWTTSGGNLNTDPLFADAENNDFHLLPTSPMINAGTTAVPDPPGLPTTDFEGSSRVIGTAPDIGAYEWSRVSPSEGTIGTEMTITGSGYDIKKGKILIGTASLKILEWTDDSIRSLLSKALPPDTYDLTIRPKTKGSSPIIIANGFTVKAPEIESVEPSHGAQGAGSTIRGNFFGTKKGKVTLGGKTCKVLRWTMDPTTGESEIEFVVPKRLTPGVNELKIINGMGSDTITFTVE